MFSDEKWLSAKTKEKILRDWHTFIRHGFRFEDFSEALYHHLIQHASFIAHYDRQTFWEVYFDNNFGHFARFINQFGGDLRAAELGLPDWMLSHTGADLNAAMITDMRLFFEIFITVLEEEAIAAYNAEKWAELRALNPDADSQRMSHLAMIYEDLYPLRDYARYGPVTAAVRDRLRRAAREFIAGEAAPTLFEAQAATPPPVTAQASVFERNQAASARTERLAATAPGNPVTQYQETHDGYEFTA